MTKRTKVAIRKLPTGVPGLDQILGGGLPEFSFNIIAGTPGCGKTTLAHQIAFANATAERPALYFTILGEPALKMLRYQQQYDFYDETMMGSAIRFINLSEQVLKGDWNVVLDAIISEVEAANPAIVIVDSFRSMARKFNGASGETDLQSMVQRLAMHLTSWQATTFLLGEYSETELSGDAVFTVADGIITLHQSLNRNSMVRKMQVMKCRGQDTLPGMHIFRITNAGLQAFPRMLGLAPLRSQKRTGRRLSTGIAELDTMTGGGIPEGDSILIAGASGTGKSILCTQFIAEGLRQGEAAIIAVFEERPAEYANRAATFGLDLKSPQKTDKLEILYLRPLDLSVDEALYEIMEAAKRVGAKRLVIDSLAGFERALAPDFREDFEESLYRMFVALTGIGVTIMSTLMLEESFTKPPSSNYSISFLTDDIIRMRYVEIDGQMRKIMMVSKMRGGDHSKHIREYEISGRGIELRSSGLEGFHGLTTGLPARVRS
ncbi:MAG: AAA family ATPase [Flavobacteriales bacterium]|nr:AAA family ATPase [Flavobacteriales bacterium]MBK9286767.1 AAA family ATPase [Flavobacteriales bacterium]MBL0035254.1 AAA family ATPase [Flavobacteriales bacterium]